VKIEPHAVRAFRLARHHLRRRAARSRIVDVTRDVVAVHAQVMSAGELSLAARVNGLRSGDVGAALWTDRTLVKSWAFRGTLHLVAAEDLPLFCAALSTYRPWEGAAWRRGWDIEEGEVEAIVDAVAEALDGTELTREELAEEVGRRLGRSIGERLRSGWGSFLKPAAWNGRLCFAPSRGRNVAFTRADQWLGGWSEHDPQEALREVARRFLRAYGPATHDEFARWFGTPSPPARRLFADMAGELAEVEVAGRRAWMVPGDHAALRRAKPGGEVRLLPNFDVFVVGGHPRDLHVPKAHTAKVWRKSAWVSPVVSIDGEAAGVWEQRERRGRVALTVSPFGGLPRPVRQGIEAEAERLGRFLGKPVDVEVAG
jgi:hypothetical protein